MSEWEHEPGSHCSQSQQFKHLAILLPISFSLKILCFMHLQESGIEKKPRDTITAKFFVSYDSQVFVQKCWNCFKTVYKFNTLLWNIKCVLLVIW